MLVDFSFGSFGRVFNDVGKLFVEGSGFLFRCVGWFITESDNSV